MNKEEIFNIIKENSYMKYCICQLIENIPNCREYKNLKTYLEQIIVPDYEQSSKEQYDNIDKFINKLKGRDE